MGDLDLLYYLAHPVAPKDSSESVRQNLRFAESYLGALFHYRVPVIAPWISIVEAAVSDQDKDSGDRDFGLRIDIDVVERCDGLVMVGPRVSSGMNLERHAARAAGLPIWDMTGRSPYVVAQRMAPIHERHSAQI
jgi:hypothetical protein